MRESESPMVQQLKIMINQLNPFAGFHPDLPALLQRLQSAQIELQDIAGEVDRISDHVNYDPEKVERLNERLSLGYKLQKKHGVNTTAELLSIQAGLQDKLQAVLNIDQSIAQKEKEKQQLYDSASMLAQKISANRKKQVKPFEDKVNKLLHQVGMPNARIKTMINPVELMETGADNVEFLFDANVPAGDQASNKVLIQFRSLQSGIGNQRLDAMH